MAEASKEGLGSKQAVVPMMMKMMMMMSSLVLVRTILGPK